MYILIVPPLSSYPSYIDKDDGTNLPDIDPEYLIVITFWDNHAQDAKSINPGSYLKIINGRSKVDSSGRIEIGVHGDQVFRNKIQVYEMGINDPEIADLLQ